MRLMLKSALVSLCLAITVPATAGPFEDGLAAYQAKDYETALRSWRVAAAQGDAKAQHNLGSMYRTGQEIGRAHV